MSGHTSDPINAHIWVDVRRLLGQTLHTARGHPFTVDSITDAVLVATPMSTGEPRQIRRAEIERSFSISPVNGVVRPTDIRREGVSNFNPAYCAAIVNNLRTDG